MSHAREDIRCGLDRLTSEPLQQKIDNVDDVAPLIFQLGID